MGSHRLPLVLPALAATTLLAACAAGGGGAAPTLPATADLATQMHLTQVAPEALPAPDWWKRYQDEELDRWIDAALRDNPGPRIARARLDRARSIFDVASSARVPTIAFDAQSTVERFSTNGIFPPPLGGSQHSLNDADLDARWDIDFFGRIGQRIAAAGEQAQASEAALADTRVRLAAAVTHAYFALAHAQQSEDLARRELELRTRQLALIAERARAGLDTEIDRRSALGPVPLARLEVERASERVALCRDALAALAGAAPDAAASVQARLPAPGTAPRPDALPIDLLARRADVAASLAQARSALHGVQAAQADFYPDVSVSALVGLDSLGLAHFLSGGSRTWAVTPALHLPLFEGGMLRAQLHGARSDAEVAIENYRRSVLDAAHEAADALVSVRSAEQQRAAQQAALANAQAALSLAGARHDAGLANELPVVAARGQLLAQERASLDLALRASDLDVNLTLALGGGYLNPAETTAR